MNAVVMLIGLAMICWADPAVTSARATAKPKSAWVYVGTYTDGKSGGIHVLEIDLETGALSSPKLAAESVNPSFLAIHPDGRHLYAVNEIGDFGGQKAGAVSAFVLEPKTGALTLLNQQSSRGDGPCHLVVDRRGANVLLANYGGGSVAVLPIQPGGRLAPASSFIQHKGSSVTPGRQSSPHGHSINVDAANRYAVAADLGLDKLLVYKLDSGKGTLTPNDPPFTAVSPGAGPRHFAFHPDGHHAYVINEIQCSVTAFEYDPERGTLKPLQTMSTLAENGLRKGYSTAEVQIHPSGKFLYGSNRGHDSIAIFSIDPKTGELTSLGREPTQGKTPRNFGIDPTGSYLLAANQDSGTIVVFRIDPESGRLQATGQRVEVPKPVCVKFLAKSAE
jgi:6-phosphogluconolactonase